MAEEWFYVQGDRKVGPITAKELKSLAEAGQLTEDDLVWKHGMNEWKVAGKVRGLFAEKKETKPKIPVARRLANPGSIENNKEQESPFGNSSFLSVSTPIGPATFAVVMPDNTIGTLSVTSTESSSNSNDSRNNVVLPTAANEVSDVVSTDNAVDACLFSGSGYCPQCQSLISIDWHSSYESMMCTECQHVFDGEQAIDIVFNHETEKNQTATIDKVREAMRLTKLTLSQGLLSTQFVTSNSTDDTDSLSKKQDDSAHSIVKHPSFKRMNGEENNQKTGVFNKIASFYMRKTKEAIGDIKSLVSAIMYYQCPSCNKRNGEKTNTELIDRQAALETRYQYEQAEIFGGKVTRRLAQVVVYHDFYWQYFRCKFCGHNWKEKHKTTWQP